MFLNHIKSIFRKIKKEKFYAFIKILGLALGIASCLLIFLFVQDELKYDTFHKKSDRIYRILAGDKEMKTKIPIHPAIMLPSMQEQLPEIKEGVRIEMHYTDELITVGNNKYAADLALVDSNFFDIFSFNMIKGDPKKALSKPGSAILTSSVAKKYFGDADPIGKKINLAHEINLSVAGIMKDIPEHSHMRPEILVSFESLKLFNPGASSSWDRSGTNIYLLLKKNVNISALQNKMKHIYDKVKPEESDDRYFKLQPLENIYLDYANVGWDAAKKGNIKIILVFSLIALLILLIACFNYMNLTTADFVKERKNTGIIRTLGAQRKHLISRYLLETTVFTFLACWLAFIAVELLIQPFSHFLEKDIQLNLMTDYTIPFFIGLIFLTIFLGGSYPAFLLSSFSPLSNILESPKNKNHLWKKSMFIAQFTIATALIISSIIIYKQIKLITIEKAGFNKEHVISINNPWNEHLSKRYRLYTNAITQHPHVRSYAGCFNTPGEQLNNHGDIYLAYNTDHKVFAGYNHITDQYLDVLEVNVLKGRNFQKERKGDSTKAILNKKAVTQLGISNPLGKDVFCPKISKSPFRIIGVVENIHYGPLKEKKIPVIYTLKSSNAKKILIKTGPEYSTETLQYLKQKWNTLFPEWPFQFEYLDNKLEQIYKTELKTLTALKIFTTLAIFLSCLGLFGFAGFTIKQRTKEIGIRKVNGAKTGNILTLLSIRFVKWIIVSVFLACPIAYYAMNRWLQNYAYKTEMSWWIFILAGMVTISIALLTITWQSWRAARQNPVESLRYE